MTASSPDEWHVMCIDCENRESSLTPWEREFIASIKERIELGRGLSPLQAEKLDTIWERVT